MNVQILYDGTDVTHYVIEYSRQQQICTGIGNASFTLSDTVNITPQTYKEFQLYEDGIKKGAYVVTDFTNNVPNGTISFGCQDYSKRLQDYFIPDTFLVTEPTHAKDIIIKYLNEAKVSYSFNTGQIGSLVNNNSVFGLTDVLSTVIQMIQMNAWYLHFSPDNVAQIGKFSLAPGQVDANIDETTCLNFSTSTNSNMFRNRAVVYGMGDIINDAWVTAEIDQHGRYEEEYDSNDVRSIVISNGYIPDGATAQDLAKKAINEFTKRTFEVSIDAAGAFDIVLGDSVHLDHPSLNFTGIVTSIGSSLSSQGLITHVVLNQRCPRIFGYYDFGMYVYVATEGAGVWRKPIQDDDTWENFSQGLSDLYVEKLSMSNSVLSCVTKDGTMYSRYPIDTQWNPVTGFPTIDELTGTSVAGDGEFTSCTVDRFTGTIYGSYNIIAAGEARSWIVSKKNKSNLGSTNVLLSGDNNMGVYDIDSNGYAVYATTINPIAPSGLYNHTMNRATNWDNSYMQDQDMTNYTSHINASNSYVEPIYVGATYTYTFAEGDFVYYDWSEDIDGIYYAGVAKYQISTGEMVDFLGDEEYSPNWINVWINYPYAAQSAPGVFWYTGDTTYDATELAVVKYDFNTHTTRKWILGDYINEDHIYSQNHLKVIGNRLFVFYQFTEYWYQPGEYSSSSSGLECAMFDLDTDEFLGVHHIKVGLLGEEFENTDLNCFVTAVDDTVIGLYGYAGASIYGEPENGAQWITYSINTAGEHYVSNLVLIEGDSYADGYLITDVDLAVLYPDYDNHCVYMIFKYDPNNIDTDADKEIRQINKDSSSHRKYGSSPLYLYSRDDNYSARSGSWSMLAGKHIVYPVVWKRYFVHDNPEHTQYHFNIWLQVFDPDGIFILYSLFDENTEDDRPIYACVLEDQSDTWLYEHKGTIWRAWLDYPINSRQIVTDQTHPFTGQYSTINPMGDKIWYWGKYWRASSDGLTKLLEYKDNGFRHVANVHKETHVDTSYPSIISAYAGDEDLNTGEIFMYDAEFMAPLVVVPPGNVNSVRGFLDTFEETPILRELFTSQGSTWIYQLIDPIDYSTPQEFVEFNGEVVKLETTNNQLIPYMFASVITDRNRFYQKDAVINITETEGTFTDRTTNLPDVQVNVIRVDDTF